MKNVRRARRQRVRKPQVRLHAYKPASGAAKSIAGALGVLQIATNSKFIARDGDTLINFGSNELRVPTSDKVTIINHPTAVKLASNKVLFFRALQGYDNIQTVPSTERREEAQQWHTEGFKVYCRTLTRSHSGAGIVTSHGVDAPLVHAGLYCKAIEGKRREVRIHVFDGKVVLIQQKRRREGWRELENYSDEVRNFHTGWIYSVNNVTELPPQAEQMAIDTVMALGLDFGAVDMITQRGECYVLEVNTVPGMEEDGSTLVTYATALANKIGIPYDAPMREQREGNEVLQDGAVVPDVLLH